MQANGRTTLFSQLIRLVGVYRYMAESDYQLDALLNDLGWNPSVLSAIEDAAGSNWRAQFSALLNTTFPAEVILELLNFANQAEGYEQNVNALIQLGELIQSAKALTKGFDLPDGLDSKTTVALEELGLDAFSHVATTYLEVHYPALYFLGRLLTFIRSPEDISQEELQFEGKPLRSSQAPPRLDLSRIKAWIAGNKNFPDGVRDLLRRVYLQDGGFTTEEQARFVSSRLFSRLQLLLSALGVRAYFGLLPTDGGGEEPMLHVRFENGSDVFEVTLALSPKDQGDLGLVVISSDNLNGATAQSDGWDFEFTLGSVDGTPIQSLAINWDKVFVQPDGVALNQAGLRARLGQDGETAVLIGDPGKPLLEIGELVAEGLVEMVDDGMGSSKPKTTLSFSLNNGRFAIDSLFSAAWESAEITCDLTADETVLGVEGLTLSFDFLPELLDIVLDLRLVYAGGKLVLSREGSNVSVSTIVLHQPALGPSPVHGLALDTAGGVITVEDGAVLIRTGKAELELGAAVAGWDELTLAVEPEQCGLDIRGFHLKTDLVPGVHFKADIEVAFDNEGEFQANQSSFVLLEPQAIAGQTTLLLERVELDRNAQTVTITLGDQAPLAFGGLTFGWTSLGLTFRGAGNYPVGVNFEKLSIGRGGTAVVELDAELDFGKQEANPPIKVSSFDLIRPNLGDFDLDPASFFLSKEALLLKLPQSVMARLLNKLVPNYLGDQPLPAGEEDDTFVVRVSFGNNYGDVREVRADWSAGSDKWAFTLPGLRIEPPNPATFSLIMGQPPKGPSDERTLNNLAFVVTLPPGAETKVKSCFSWDRANERELQSDAKQPGEAEAPSAQEPTLFELGLKPEGEVMSLVLADFDLGNGGLPQFFRQMTSNSPLTHLKGLDLAAAATENIEWSIGDLSDSWNATFAISDQLLTFPFLRSAATQQFVQVHEVKGRKIDIPNGKIEITVVLLVQVVGTLYFRTEIDVEISLSSFAISMGEHSGLELLAPEEQLEGDFLGLHWRFKGAEKGSRHHYFNLLTADYDYRIQQAPGCKLELDYNMLGREPITFDVENFELGENGVSLLAKVTDRPARLNGINTRFRFQDSSFEIVENEIQAFTLQGSGPVPPALLGEGTADIALQFEQRDGNLRLISGGAKLKGIKELHSKKTRFQYSIEALGLKFVDDGAFHLYFTLTGSARFVAAPGDKDSPLALLSNTQLELVDCPVTGDMSVLGKHISFLIPLPKPRDFDFLGCFGMEVRGIGFYPQAEVFGGDPALLIAGQIRFAEGAGDAASTEIDHHRLYVGLPKKGDVLPRIHLSELPLNISMGEAFKLTGMVSFVDNATMTGFSGEGVMQIKGLPTMAAAFSFLRVRETEVSQWLRAWFIYLEVRQVSFPVPVVQLYLREVGLGFGYRFTLASIKAADRANDLGELIGDLEKLSRTQGNLATLSAWDLDVEEPGEDPRWTVVLRALISQTTASPSPLQWNETAERDAKNAFLFDAVIALRSDFTFFMAVRAWLNTNYFTFFEDGEIRNSPLFSGFVIITPKKRRLLAHLASNPDGHTGSNPELPQIVVKALKNGEFSATLLIEPGLVHYELGWPNQLRWADRIGIIDAEFRGGSIMRVSETEIVIGTSFTARGTAEIGTSVDLGFVGAEISAVAKVAFGARYIGVVFFERAQDSAFYGAIGLEAQLDFAFRAWIRFQIRINLGFKKITITIQKDFRISATVDFTAALEVGILLDDTGAKGRGTLAVSALGHRLELDVSLTLGESSVDTAKSRTARFLHVGLEASDVDPIPGTALPESAGDVQEISGAGTGGVSSVEPAAAPAGESAALPASASGRVETIEVPGLSASEGIAPETTETAADGGLEATVEPLTQVAGKSWRVLALNGGDQPPSTSLTITFGALQESEDAAVFVNGRHKDYRGKAQFGGSALAIADLAEVEREGEEAPHGDDAALVAEEEAFIRALNEASTYESLNDSQVALRNAAGAELLTLESLPSAPEYVMFVVRRPNKNCAYFAILPKGEEERGFLPPPPRRELELDEEDKPKLKGEGEDQELIYLPFKEEEFHDFEIKFPAAENFTLTQYECERGDFGDGNLSLVDSSLKFLWRANWLAKMGEAEQVDHDGDSETGNSGKEAELHEYLLPAYRIAESPSLIKGEPAEVSVDGSLLSVTEEHAIADPDQPGTPKRIGDERVHDPGESAYEAAVRGAVEQFRGSPFFKRDENYEYDRLLAEAFSPDTSIYEPIKEGGEGEIPNTAPRPQEQDRRARQVRGVIVQDIIEDLRAHADGQPFDKERSLAFQMGLVFKIEPTAEALTDGELKLPDWLDELVEKKEEAPTIRQRLDPAGSAPVSEPKPVRPFNIAAASFKKKSPECNRLNHYTTANTIALAWDLTWPGGIHARSTVSQDEPEHHLHHYEVRRQALATNERDVVRTVSPVQVLHRNGDGLIGLKPRFQVVDHFNEETLEEQAALPAEGRSYYYTITPVDFEGNPGRPMTLLATRYPDDPPLVPANAQLTIPYDVTEALSGVSAVANAEPVLMQPEEGEITLSWTRPKARREGPEVIAAKYHLVFRRENTLPIGSYGLDAETEQSRAKSLPSSTAIPRESDIRISIDSRDVSGGNDQPPNYRQTGPGLGLLQKLKVSGVFPRDGLWRPGAWRVYIQAEASTGAQSALAPVKLVLKAITEFKDKEGEPQERYDEWPVDALEWLPAPDGLTMPLLPAEDAALLPGHAHVPVPATPNPVYGGTLENVSYQPHPAGTRVVRFRWNQGSSHDEGLPLDLYAGYHIWKLDADAHTTETFNDGARLEAALRRVQEVRMSPADDLPLTPGDTLATSQWEAWYPSLLARIRDGKEQEVEGADARLGAWYSWRDSLLIWPRWPGLTVEEGDTGQTPTRNDPFHPYLAKLVHRLARTFQIAEADDETNQRLIDSLIPGEPTHALRQHFARNGISLTARAKLSKRTEEEWLVKDGKDRFSVKAKNNGLLVHWEDRNASAIHIVELQNGPPMRPVQLAGFLEATAPKPDPYGWGILQRLGLSAAFILRRSQDGELIERRAVLDLLNDVLEEAIEDLAGDHELRESLKRHLHVELLFQPAQSISLTETPVGDPDRKLLALVQLSLRPIVKQIRTYGRMVIKGLAGSEVLLAIAGHGTNRSMIVQSAQAGEEESGAAHGQQLEIEQGQRFEHAITLPVSGETMLLFRVDGDWEPPDIEVVLSPRQPLSEAQMTALSAKYDAVSDGTGSGVEGGAIIERSTKELRPKKEDLEGLNAAVRAAEGQPFTLEAVHELFSFTLEGPEEIHIVGETPSGDADEHLGHLSSYFTVPEPATMATEITTESDSELSRQWRRLQHYLHALNSPDVDADQILLPSDQASIEATLPNVLGWLQRFFDHSGEVASGGAGAQTGIGPWLVTAYPRAGSPAYATPDAAGRLRYDHLLEDRWAHNYRYYIQPYSRYDGLWRSFRQSRALFPEPTVDKPSVAILGNPSPDPEAGGLDLVLDRTYPLDRPLVLRAGRLDKEGSGTSVPPGRTWEVIVAKHKEQELVERNQTLARQLSFRQLAFTLQRRFGNTEWLTDLKELHQLPESSLEEAFEFAYVEKRYPQLPATLAQTDEPAPPEVLEGDVISKRLEEQAIAGVEFPSGHKLKQALSSAGFTEEETCWIARFADTSGGEDAQKWRLSTDSLRRLDVDQARDRRDLALPARIKSFQQGAVALQWQALPYYYQHRLLLVAQATSVVSPVTAITQQDFEYVSPEPLIYARGDGDEVDAELNASKRKLRLVLARYWDCLPEEARKRWPGEDPEEKIEGKRKLSSLPDPDIVYQLVETFSGNIEVQVEIKFDPVDKRFVARRLGRKFEGNIDGGKGFEVILNLWSPEGSENAPSRYVLELTLAQNEKEASPIAQNNGVQITRDDVEPPVPKLAQIERREDDAGNEATYLTFEGFMNPAQASALLNMFEEDDEANRQAVQQLYKKSIQTGVRGRELRIRARRGSAKPTEARQFIAPTIESNDD